MIANHEDHEGRHPVSVPPPVVAGLAASFVAATGYRRKKVTIEEAKEHWTPEQREKADREVKELLGRESRQ